jgi:hypothetical protein
MEASGVTHAETDGKPVFRIESADVVDALEYFLAEDIDMPII